MSFQFIHQKSIKRHVNKLSNVQFHGILKHLASGFSLRVISIKIIDVGVDILRKSGKFSNIEEGKASFGGGYCFCYPLGVYVSLP